MAAQRLHLEGELRIEQGASWQHTVRLEVAADVPRDLSGCSARMQIRAQLDGDVRLSPDCSIDAPAGRITLALSDTQTAALNLATAHTCWLYDLELQSPTGTVERLLEGRVLITREITR